MSTAPTSSPSLRWGIGISAILIVLLDQGTKWWAETTLDLRVYNPVIGELLGWRLVYNPGRPSESPRTSPGF